MNKACEHCPWRLSNQGKKTPWGFYTKANLRRLWNGIRRGIAAQSCHPTDPSHPDHVAAGAKVGSTARECPGSVIVVLREVKRMANSEGVVAPEGLARYKQERPKLGLTKSGQRFWLVERLTFGGQPFIGGAKLPEVDIDDAAIGLPAELQEG